ncbi:hypothetical protein [Azospirillum halopraeferens]|uniref:hypothetical protein n=1 Tax=Azospirillum halopraeferens TaxID=34010 RepID=UPI00049141FC|nr:hypothetical protein [Azospirillum halopraeferens]
MTILRLVLAILVLVVAAPPPAVAFATAGHALCYTESVGVEVRRKGRPDIAETIPPGQLFRVGEEDVISAAAAATIEMAPAGGAFRTIHVGPDRPHTVAARGPDSSLPDNLFNWLNRLFGPADGSEKRHVISVRTAALSVPLQRDKGNRIVATGDRLPIAWVGGQGGVSITLEADSQALIELTGLQNEGRADIVLPKGSFTPGSYRITLTDSMNTVKINVQAFAPSSVPVSALAATAGADPALGPLLDAAELATVDNGAWRMEAYRRLIADGSLPALRLAARLAEGRFPLEVP